MKTLPANSHFQTAKQGFTLVELTSVLTTISLLAAVLIPAIVRTRSSADASVCRSNLKQLSLALLLYIGDHDRYPLFSSGEPIQPVLWTDLLAPFVSEPIAASAVLRKFRSSFRCPATEKFPAVYDRHHITYGYGDEGFAFQGLGVKVTFGNGEWTAAPVREDEVQRPVQTIALGDGVARLKSGPLHCAGVSLKRWQLAEPVSESWQQLLEGDRSVRRLHSGRANVAFCDGHVESNTLKLLFEDTSDDALRRWNRDNEPHRDWLISY